MYCYVQGVTTIRGCCEDSTGENRHQHELKAFPFPLLILPLKEQKPIYSQFFFRQAKEEMQSCQHSSYFDNDKTTAHHS